MRQLIHREGELNPLSAPAGLPLAGVLEACIEHQGIQGHTLFKQLSRGCPHCIEIRQIADQGLRGT